VHSKIKNRSKDVRDELPVLKSVTENYYWNDHNTPKEQFSLYAKSLEQNLTELFPISPSVRKDLRNATWEIVI
jgi:hypothetical protein